MESENHLVKGRAGSGTGPIRTYNNNPYSLNTRSEKSHWQCDGGGE